MGTDEHQEIADGINLAKAAAIAHLQNDEPRVLELINSATSGNEVGYAFGYALGMVHVLALQLAGGDHERALELVSAGVADDEDIIDSQMKLMTKRAGQDD